MKIKSERDIHIGNKILGSSRNAAEMNFVLAKLPKLDEEIISIAISQPKTGIRIDFQVTQEEALAIAGLLIDLLVGVRTPAECSIEEEKNSGNLGRRNSGRGSRQGVHYNPGGGACAHISDGDPHSPGHRGTPQRSHEGSESAGHREGDRRGSDADHRELQPQSVVPVTATGEHNLAKQESPIATLHPRAERLVIDAGVASLITQLNAEDGIIRDLPDVTVEEEAE